MTWKLINKLTGKNKTNSNEIFKNTLFTNGQHINPQKEPSRAANILNTFFTGIGEKYTKNFKKISTKDNNMYCSSTFNEIFLKNIDSAEVLKIINSLKDDSSAGFDKISVKTLKRISKFIVNPLTMLFNASLKEGIFPDIFKLAIVKPLYKSGIKENLSNYRPISLLCNFSKILEKIVKSRLIIYLEKNNLISKNQFGFQPGKSTTGALYETTKFLYNELDNNKKVLAFFFRFGKSL